jgi:sRNA-binding protein
MVGLVKNESVDFATQNCKQRRATQTRAKTETTATMRTTTTRATTMRATTSKNGREKKCRTIVMINVKIVDFV